MFNLRKLDLNLLHVFEAVYEAGSVKAGADRLGLSESATSHALARLRETTGQEFFIRSGQRLVPTALAQSLFPDVKHGLDCVRRSMANIVAFIPEHSKREFRIAIAHPMGAQYAVRLRNMVKADAPDVNLIFDTSSRPADLEAKLRDGDIHMAVDWLPIDAGWCVHEKLFDDQLMVLAREGHPRIDGKLTLDDLLEEEVIHLDHRLEAEYCPTGLREIFALPVRVGFVAKELLEILPMVLASDMLGIFAGNDCGYLEGRGYQLLPFPADVPPFRVNLMWKESYRRDGGHAWMRQMLKDAVSSFSCEQRSRPFAGHPYVSRQLVAA